MSFKSISAGVFKTMGVFSDLGIMGMCNKLAIRPRSCSWRVWQRK